MYKVVHDWLKIRKGHGSGERKSNRTRLSGIQWSNDVGKRGRPRLGGGGSNTVENGVNFKRDGGSTPGGRGVTPLRAEDFALIWRLLQSGDSRRREKGK